jgi:hypothetical protein
LNKVTKPWSRFGSSHFELLDEELELSFGFLRSSVLNLKSGELLVTGHRVETAKQLAKMDRPTRTNSLLTEARLKEQKKAGLL